MEYFKNCMTQEQLEQEHRKLVIKMHPDRNPDNPNATAEFQEMQQQYEERKAELNGDYSKARKGRERREREDRERRERERREQERRKKEMAIDQARKNKQRSHLEWKQGEYVYARLIKGDASAMVFARSEYILRAVLTAGVAEDETVVKIETIVELTDECILCDDLHHLQPDGGPWGGRDVLQDADPANGIYKKQTVAKVILFRSPNYCFFGNPMGDQMISYFYMPSNYGTMFHSQLDALIAKIAWERSEAERLEQERQAKLLAEQKPLIDEWQSKLIGMSAGLSGSERQTVAMSNLKTMLKQKFQGTTFTVKKDRYNDVCIKWEDGPTVEEVCGVMDLFDAWKLRGGKEPTPWMEHYGQLTFSLGNIDRKMSVLTKARILQQLGSVTEAFRENQLTDDVEVSDFDWVMLHLLVGIEVGKGEKECISTLHADGKRTVNVAAAVRFVFNYSSFAKATKASKKSKKAA